MGEKMKLQWKCITAEQGYIGQLVLGTGDPSLVLCEDFLVTQFIGELKCQVKACFFKHVRYKEFMQGCKQQYESVNICGLLQG